MKIGVLTYFWAENPGTFLQAYSTYQAVKKLFPDDKVEMINVRLRKVYFRPSKTCLLSAQNMFKDFNRYRSYKKALVKMEFSSGKYIGQETDKALEYIKKQNYDIIFVGSDTIFQLYDWNFEKDVLPVYYLEGVSAKKVMLAASCGSTTTNDFSPGMRKIAGKCLKEFYKMGVRDKNTYNLFYELKGDNEDMEIIPDPTFTYQIDLAKARKVLIKNNFDFDKKSVVINVPGYFPFLNETVKYFKNKSWNIITYYYAKYADYCLFLHPDEWAGIPHFVDLVITDRFHDSVFCIKNNTPVIGVDCHSKRVSKLNSSKVKNLFEEFGIVENYINVLEKQSGKEFFDKIEQALKMKNNYNCINQEKKTKYLDFIQSIK